jgi:hypothetical protein
MRRRRGGGAEEEKPLALGTSFMKPNLGSALTMATRVVLKTKSGVWEKFDDVLTLSEAISLTHLIEEAYFDVMGKEDEKE